MACHLFGTKPFSEPPNNDELPIRPLETYISEILIKVHLHSFEQKAFGFKMLEILAPLYCAKSVPRYRHCFNALGPSDTIWGHKSGSTLAQVMPCCLTAPVLTYHHQWACCTHLKPISQEVLKIPICKMCLKNILEKLFPYLSGPMNSLKELNWCGHVSDVYLTCTSYNFSVWIRHNAFLSNKN